jgi:hypothetical protein
VVLRAVDAAQLEQELRAWASQHDDGPGPLAVDGKTVRGSADTEAAAVHLPGGVGRAGGGHAGPDTRR